MGSGSNDPASFAEVCTLSSSWMMGRFGFSIITRTAAGRCCKQRAAWTTWPVSGRAPCPQGWLPWHRLPAWLRTAGGDWLWQSARWHPSRDTCSSMALRPLFRSVGKPLRLCLHTLCGALQRLHNKCHMCAPAASACMCVVNISAAACLPSDRERGLTIPLWHAGSDAGLSGCDLGSGTANNTPTPCSDMARGTDQGRS